MKSKGFTYSLILSLLLLILVGANLLYGSVKIPFDALWNILCGEEAGRESWFYIVWESRIPQAVTALLCGAALAAAGLLVQTAFNNPLAGPSILGINSGANLGVALVILGSSGVLASGDFSVIGFMTVLAAAFIGSMIVMGLILFFSSIIKSNIMLLIVGIMIGYIASSCISLLNFFATDEGVHSYAVWGMGNFSGVSLNQLPYFAGSVLIGLLIAILLIKPLNALLLGTRYAENLGVNIVRTRNLLLIATGVLSAVTTAFCGPIAFIDLAVPHIARLLLGTSNHNTLMPVTMLTGGVIALFCNLLCILPGESGIIPLNAVTPVLGAPVIIYVIMNRRKIKYFN
ncbi:iron ABC transporter permease [Phocaeicola abscessus]|uniref:iron ABC transporter permease n=1 Tax=Phocaeicola abscessus TaxID=555313 RepID=UPI000386B6C0|nr:iron ABC transporter permease [Phocaeicola abscessus]EPT33955.1 iron chelate uptake ABC transporter, FeCT family, permease protein [Bacteroidetes bacterium oral taxon 272 str. F0290]